MNIDDIEDNLNNYESDQAPVLREIINAVAKNQALLTTMMDYQLELLARLRPNVDPNEIVLEMQARMQSNLATIQADISSRL